MPEGSVFFTFNRGRVWSDLLILHQLLSNDTFSLGVAEKYLYCSDDFVLRQISEASVRRIV
jgi:hypothetical protein